MTPGFLTAAVEARRKKWHNLRIYMEQKYHLGMKVKGRQGKARVDHQQLAQKALRKYSSARRKGIPLGRSFISEHASATISWTYVPWRSLEGSCFWVEWAHLCLIVIHLPLSSANLSLWASWEPVIKNMPANAGDPISIPGIGKILWEGDGKPLPYSCVESSMDRGSLAGYSPCGHKESNMTKQLNNNRLVRWESRFLSMEPKNGIHKYANTQSSKWIGFIKEEWKYKALNTDTARG